MPGYLTAALRQQLKLQKVPYELVDEQRLESGPRSECLIVLQRDPAGDGWAPPSGRLQRENARLIMQRMIGMQLTIYAQSTDPNAATVDHEDEADRIVDQLGRALYTVLKVVLPDTLGVASTAPRMGQSRFLTKEQIGELKLMTWPGRIYVMPFQLDWGVYDTDWTGAPPPSIVVGPDDVPITTTYDFGDAPGPGKELPGADTEIEEAP
jgi:hypothetical protein